MSRSRETLMLTKRTSGVETRYWMLALSVLVSACGGADQERSVAEESSQASDAFCQSALAAVETFMAASAGQRMTGEKYGGTVVVGSNSEIAGGMGALTSVDQVANQHHKFVNLMSLIRYDADLGPVPYLAERWELSEDATELIFHIRRDVFWHDGTPTTAYDVEFTIRRAMDDETAYPNGSFWTSYDKESVELIDSFTVKVDLQPHNEIMDTWRSLAILPVHLLGDVPSAELAQHPYNTQCPVGNGPFVFDEHVASDRWEFVANPVFPDGVGGQPFLDRYIYRVAPEQTTLLSELLTGGIDVYVAPLAEQVAQIQAAEHLELRNYSFRQSLSIAWNGRLPKLSDRRVRRAITMATNRAEMLEVLRFGMGTVANTTVPPSHWGYDPEMASVLPYDPAGARALLAEAGWEDRDGDGVVENAEGERFTLILKTNPHQEREDIAEVMQAQLGAVGIEMSIEVLDFSTIGQQITSKERDFEGVFLGFIVEFRIDDSDLFLSDRSDAPYAFAGLNDPVLDETLRKIPITVNRDEAIPLLHEYQRKLVDAQPFTMLFYPDRLQGVNRRVRGAVMDIRGGWVNLSDWWIAPDQRN